MSEPVSCRRSDCGRWAYSTVVARVSPLTRSALRATIVRTARCRPSLTAEQIAALVGCHTSTVRKHLAASRGKVRLSPGRLTSRHAKSPRRQAEVLSKRSLGVSPTLMCSSAGSSPPTPAAGRRCCAASQQTPTRESPRRQRDTRDARRRASRRQPATATVSARPTKAAAAHPRLPAVALGRLAASRSAVVRAAAASNPRCPVVLLRHLASDGISSVRGPVARNAATDAQTLTQLATDTDSGCPSWRGGASPMPARHCRPARRRYT